MTNCINCSAPVNPEEEKCNWCGTYYSTSGYNIFKSQKARKSGIYPAFIVAGIAMMLIIYGLVFDSLSETLLINLSPVWVCSVMFGLFGYTAEKAVTLVAESKAKDFREGYALWKKESAAKNPLLLLLVVLFCFPLRFVNSMNPLWSALTGTLFWLFLLLVFLNGIFPSL